MFACIADHILSIDDVLLIVLQEFMDSTLIGMRCNAVVGNTNSYPKCALLVRTFADHLHQPKFVFIGNGEGLATAGVTIFFYQTGHLADGLARRFSALQGDAHKTYIIKNALRIYEFRTSAEG